MLDASLFGPIDLRSSFAPEEDLLHLRIEELPGLGIPGIKAVVIHEHGLVLEPVSPAVLADLLMDSLTYGVLEGGLLEGGLFTPATTTTNLIHEYPVGERRTNFPSGKDKAPRTDSGVKEGGFSPAHTFSCSPAFGWPSQSDQR